MVYVFSVLTTVPLRVMVYLGSGRPSDLHVITTDVPTTAVFDVNVVLSGLAVKKQNFLLLMKIGKYSYFLILLKNSLIIHEENTKKNHKRVVSVYVIQIHVDLHKL